MSGRDSADFSESDLLGFLCPHCLLSRRQMQEFGFPPPNYLVGSAPFWKPGDLRPWIEARARVNFLAGRGIPADVLNVFAALTGAEREFGLNAYATITASSPGFPCSDPQAPPTGRACIPAQGPYARNAHRGPQCKPYTRNTKRAVY